MLWYKSWLETRWRFLIGLVVLICSALATVFTYPRVLELLPLVPAHVSGELGRKIMESAALAREYRGYVWSQWFSQNLPQTWILFAVLIGTGGSFTSSGAALFTLSLPASRNRMFGTRVIAGLIELFAMVFIPSLFISLFSPGIGQSYGIANALVHSACLFIGGSVFFSLATLLSTEFSDIWRPMLISLAAAAVLSFLERALQFGVFHVIHGESYFRRGSLPWIGLLGTAAVSIAFLYGAAMNIARRDF